MLTSPDAARRQEAAERLQGLPAKVSGPHLLQRLRDGDPGVRARAAKSLGPLVLVDAAPLLIDCISDPDSSVRSACADALGQFGALPREQLTRATAQLGRALGDTQFEVRLEVLRALDRLLQAGLFSTADATLLLGPLLLRVEDENVGVRRGAVSALGQLRSLSLPKELLARVVVAVLGRLSDSARDVRAEALASLGKLGSSSVGQAALRMLRDPTEEVRKQAVLCLGRLRFAPAVPALVEIFESGPLPLRAAAATALGQLAISPDGSEPAAAATSTTVSAPSVLALESLLRGVQRPELRPLARESLLTSGAKVLPAVLQRLRGGTGTQSAAVAAEEVTALVELLRDLAKTASQPQRRELTQALIEELWRGRLPREQLLDALAVVGDQSSAAVCAGLLADKDVVVRRHAVRALRQPGLLDRRALDALLQATRDSDFEVAVTATQALGDLGGEPALARLVQILTAPAGVGTAAEASSVALRVAAATALGQASGHAGATVAGEQVMLPLVTVISTFREGAGEQRVRRAAAMALGRVCAGARQVPSAVLAALVTAVRKGRGNQAAWPEVLAALGSVVRVQRPGSDAARELLTDLALSSGEPGSPEAGLALDALDALAALRDPVVARRLLRLAEHRDPLRRLRAAAVFGALLSTPGADVSALVATLVSLLLQDQDARVVAEAAWALSQLSKEAAQAKQAIFSLRQAVLPNAVHGQVASVRSNAVAALARLGAATVADAECLTDEDPGVRANCAQLLASLPSRSPGMDARLRNLAVVDADPRVRASALASLGGKKPVPLSQRQHWLGMYQIDYDGKPLDETRYRLTLSDSLVRVGFTDTRGIAREELLPGGTCDLEPILSSR